MDYHANIDGVLWFAKQGWPLIEAAHPGLRFTVVGRNPADSVQTLASRRIEVTGTVDDVRPYYREAFAVVVPLRIGSGTRLKILEAMAAGVPVISTRLGAEGIEAIPDRHILIADTPEEMSAAVRRLRAEPEIGSHLAEEARRLVLSRYDWAVIGSQLFQIHSEVVSRARER
jgi:glycosyltransferase involved in cell wall biosynthesis